MAVHEDTNSLETQGVLISVSYLLYRFGGVLIARSEALSGMAQITPDRVQRTSLRSPFETVRTARRILLPVCIQQQNVSRSSNIICDESTDDALIVTALFLCFSFPHHVAKQHSESYWHGASDACLGAIFHQIAIR